MLKRLAISSALATLGLGLVLGGEVMIARRVQRLDPFKRGQLDGVIGDGEPLRMVWLGDSTGDGVGATSVERVLPRLVAAGLRRRVDLTVLAKSGARVKDVIDSQLPELASLRPEWVFIGIGGNDVTHLTSRRRFRAQLDELLSAVGRAGATKIVLLGVGEFAATPLLAQPLRFVAGLRSDRLVTDGRAAAARAGATFVDITERTGKRFVDDPKRFHAVDGFHPSDDGYALWARATLDALDL